jgi:hypothetical protein
MQKSKVISTTLLQNTIVVKSFTIPEVEYKQLKLWESPQSKSEAEHPLYIEPLPPALQWWDEERFWLIHSETGLRVPGSWSADEAELILDLSKSWDWSIDDNRRVACGIQLIALVESVCKRSSHSQKRRVSVNG